MTVDLDAIVQEMLHAQQGATQLEPFTARFPGFGLPEAYAVSRRIHERRLSSGFEPVGRKIGFTNPDMWARYGVGAPVWAFVYQATVESLPDAAGTCRLAPFAEPKIEPEIVFGFRHGVRPGAGARDIVAALDWVAHGFEIVQSHFPGWRFQAADTVADWALHGRLFVGPRVPIAELGTDPVHALEAFEVDLACDGRLVERGRGTNVLGGPIRALEHLVAVLAGDPGGPPITAGELVTTGTITTAQPVAAGSRWNTTVRGLPLPGLTLAFEG